MFSPRAKKIDGIYRIVYDLSMKKPTIDNRPWENLTIENRRLTFEKSTSEMTLPPWFLGIVYKQGDSSPGVFGIGNDFIYPSGNSADAKYLKNK
jgi:hypothetical protein